MLIALYAKSAQHSNPEHTRVVHDDATFAIESDND